MARRFITLPAAKDGVAARRNDGLSMGAGKGVNLVVGLASWGTLYRAYIGFEDLPALLAAEKAVRVYGANLKTKRSTVDVGFGNSPRSILSRITASWNAGTRGADGGTYSDNALAWDTKPSTTATGEMDHTYPDADNTIATKSVMPLLRAALPTTVRDDLNAAGGGAVFYGIAMRSQDEAFEPKSHEIESMEGGYDAYLELDIDDNQAPLAPINLTPAPGVYVSSTGTDLLVGGTHVDPDGDPMFGYQVRAYPGVVTDAMITAGTAGTPNAPAATMRDPLKDPPFPADFSRLLSGTRRQTYTVQRRSWDGDSWGPWSSADGQNVTLDAKPAATNVTITPGSRTPTFGVSSSDADVVLGGTNGQMAALEVDVWQSTGLGRVYLWRSGKQAVALTARATIAFGSGGSVSGTPDWDQSYGWHLRIWDDADQPSDFTPDATWTPIEQTGPEIMLPADVSAKIDTLRPTFTIGATAAPFDQVTLAVWPTVDAAVPLWDAGILAVLSTTVRASSAAGQAVVAATSLVGVTVGDTIRVGHGGGTQEDGIVLSTNAVGPTITLTTNLVSTHPASETIGTMRTARQYPATDPPAKALVWGDAPFWDGAYRPVGSITMSPRSGRRQIRLNTIPQKPAVTILDALLRADGTYVVPTRSFVARIPYIDPDEALYAEQPKRKVLELRVAAAVKGTGALVETRASDAGGILADLPEDEAAGEMILPADAAAGWAGWGGFTVSAVATNPTGYGGTSLQIVNAAVAALAEGGAIRALTPDQGTRLRELYAAGALFRLWTRISNLTGEVRIAVQRTFAPAWTARYLVTPTAVNAYQEKTAAKVASVGNTGVVWESDPNQINLYVRNSAGTVQAFTANFRDLRIGSAQSGKTVPDGAPAWETSYDVSGQWGDTVAPGVMGIRSDWQTVRVTQPPTVALVVPAAAAVVTTPTPLFDWTGVSPAGKALTHGPVRVFRRVGLEDSLVATISPATPATSQATMIPKVLEHGGSWAWEVDVTDSDGLVTTLPRSSFTTAFVKPAALASVTLTPDATLPVVNVSWPAAAGAYEYIVLRRKGNGPFRRIDAQGRTWRDGVSLPITTPGVVDFGAGQMIDLDYQVLVSNGAADDATGRSDAVEGSTMSSVDGWWWLVPESESYQMQLLYVTDWNETKEISELVREPLPEESGAETRPIVQTGAMQGSRIVLEMDVGPEDADQLRLLRDASVDPTIRYGFLKSPLGDVWASKPRAIPQRKGGGPGRRSLSVPFVQVA